MFLLFSSACAESAATATDLTPDYKQLLTPDRGLKFGSMPTWGWVLFGALLVLGLALLNKRKGKHGSWSVQMLSLGAICMALSSVLSLIKLWHMPMGGSITVASMLPLMLFAYRYGTVPGLTLGAVYGVLQVLLDGGSAISFGVIPLLLDYPLGFAMVGLAGCFRKKGTTGSLVAGVVLGSAGRFLMSFISGAVYYGSYCTDYGFVSPWLYSLVYNAAYMLPDCLICVLVALLAGDRLITAMKRL